MQETRLIDLNKAPKQVLFYLPAAVRITEVSEIVIIVKLRLRRK